MEFRELVTAFGRACGVEEMEFDDKGVAALEADDYLISFIELPATRQMLVSVTVAEKPQGDGGPLFETLLKASHLGGATDGAAFSLTQEGMIALQRIEALSELDLALFSRVVESLLNQADKWRAVIAAYVPGEAKAASNETGPTPSDFLGGNAGFLQV